MLLRTPFAWRNVMHRKIRSFVALAGVSGSVLLIFMQLGFYFAVLDSVTGVLRSIKADIFLISPRYVLLGRTGTFPRQRLAQASVVDGVQEAFGFYADLPLWRNPETRLRYPILAMGFDPTKDILNIPADTSPLLHDGQVLVDSLTRPHFGSLITGVTTEIGDRSIRVAGHYTIGPGLTTDGAVLMSDDTFIRLFKGRSIEQVSVGLVRVKPGFDVNQVAKELGRRLPIDTRVLTRSQMIEAEENYWKNYTSIGPVFGAGAALGLFIGMVIVYQVLVADISNRIREYATLSALGYGLPRLKRFVLNEVSIFSIAGFGIGWLLSAGLYKIVRDKTGLPMSMNFPETSAILLLSFVMCWTAGLMATRKLRQADPADLF